MEWNGREWKGMEGKGGRWILVLYAFTLTDAKSEGRTLLANAKQGGGKEVRAKRSVAGYVLVCCVYLGW